MIINGKNYRTVWMKSNVIYTIEQRLLPHEFKIVGLKTAKEAADAIKDMMIRGAPAIGAMGAYGLAQAISNQKETNREKFIENIKKIKKMLWETRPTAYDLTHGLNFVFDRIKNQSYINNIKKIAAAAAEEYADRSAEACKKIGIFGNNIIKNNSNILTHCNAGALATVDYGTALAPIRLAYYNKKNIHVFVSETRPRNQGAKLTAWELAQENIPHSIIADSAAGYFMAKKEIDLVITGADRIAANGDAANKIGTYGKSVLAKENGIPFYIAAPFSTIDPNTKTGNEIPIEERSQEEINYISIISNNKLMKIRMTPKESTARNPAFDVTPAKYITGIITEKGIIKPNELRNLL
ncbi:S-methyl-5-thioribose-1-phosphate isomerase [Candidatus Woesearchaeota archaeon]|nr:S-methyl-5-thioribose-1-phosphate isomerase [Candidatus Woesearchaeota archaeon]